MDTWLDRAIEQEASTSTSGGSMSRVFRAEPEKLSFTKNVLHVSAYSVPSPGALSRRMRCGDDPPQNEKWTAALMVNQLNATVHFE